MTLRISYDIGAVGSLREENQKNAVRKKLSLE